MSEPSRHVRYVTLAYGDAPGVYRQSLMLLLSLVAHAPEPYELVVATDRPECYVWFGTRVEIEYLDFARLTAWKGPSPFSMRQKLELARAATPTAESGLSRVPPSATVLLDADVLAIRPLRPFVEQLDAGRLFMHKKEYVLAESRRSGNRKLWSALRRSKAFAFEASDAMWNSGVLGVPTADRPLLDQSIDLYDRLGAEGLRHFATEQLVEGVIFGRTGRLHAAHEWFVHYWGNKPGYDAEIARRLADAFIEGLTVKEAAARYRASPIDLPVEVRPSRAAKLASWLDKRRG
ncbi:MAG TPA: hypothetical protein VFK57_21925 [Vicinamibacterales bacterium]|nr:hypothetical protein [Vicinamibacterales bacterium]